jgi:hypothetical protein
MFFPETKMRKNAFILLVVTAIEVFSPQAKAGILSTSESFAVLGGSKVTNTGTTTITGNLGLSPGSSVVGFPPGIVTSGTIYIDGAVALQAQNDNATAFNGLAGMAATSSLTGQNLGGLTLSSGVYSFTDSAQLTGTLTLDAQGLNNAYWVFQIGSTLTTATASSVQIINMGSNGGSDDGLFWKVGSSATLGTATNFEGNILALTSITLTTGATIDGGRAFAQNGAVTMDTNTISIDSPYPNTGTLSGGLKFDGSGHVVPVGPDAGTVPEPDSLLMIGIGLAGLLGFGKHFRSIRRM